MTVIAAVDLDYPKDKLTVWLLDDGGTDQKCNQDNAKKAQGGAGSGASNCRRSPPSSAPNI